MQGRLHGWEVPLPNHVTPSFPHKSYQRAERLARMIHIKTTACQEEQLTIDIVFRDRNSKTLYKMNGIF